MSDDSQETGAADVRFYYMVIGLLLVVAFALAGLWVVERGNRLKAENQTRSIVQKVQEEQSRIQMAVQGLMSQQNQETWIDRTSLPTQEMTFSGKQVFLLGAEKALRLGLQPGDVVLVSQPPQTQPAAQPSE